MHWMSCNPRKPNAPRATLRFWTSPGKGEKNAPPPAPVILDLLAPRPAENGTTSVAPQ